MTHLGPWHTEDFSALSWHDVHVHGIRFASFSEHNRSADLALDIDYILKWERSASQLLFTICRAELVFHDTVGLKMELDYLSPAAGMCPFAIDGIQREPLDLSTERKSFRWHIDINWPDGTLEFEASGFTQTLLGSPIVKVGVQSLSSEERSSAA
jgi:hypothetical protein